MSEAELIPEDARPEDIADAYMRAWRLGLKGITVYRYGAKSRQVLEAGTKIVTHP